MQRFQRRRHRLMWAVLAPVILGALAYAWVNRPAPLFKNEPEVRHERLL